MTKIKCSLWNQGELFDYRNILLRQGKLSENTAIKEKYAAVNAIYQEKEIEFSQRPASEAWRWWDAPKFNVTTDEQNLIKNDREEKIKEIYEKLFQSSDIILLQELNTQEDIDFLEQNLPKHYDFAYGKELQQYKGERTDTVIIWDNRRFIQIEPNQVTTTTEVGTKAIKIANRATVTNKRRTTHVTLKDLQTEKIIQVISCHLDGFNLLKPEARSTNSGDLAALEALKLCNQQETDISIIAGDFNSEFFPSYDKESSHYTEIEHELTQNRFNLLLESGFIPLQNHQMTAYNEDIKKITGRENGLVSLDHAFIKGAQSQTSKIESDTPLEDVTSNPSDHKPLTFEIHFNP